MTDVLTVLLRDRVAGVVTRARGGKLGFDYDDAYRRQEGATPLSLSMPAQVKTHPDRVVTPWMWGLLPDNDAVLARWARRFGVSATSPFGLLASPVGQDCAGAVRFVAPDAVDAALVRPGRIRWLTEDEVAARLQDLRQDATAWLGGDFTGRFSLAGAQAKTALHYHNGRWGLPMGAAATSHILKPAISGFDDHDLNEHLCLRAAALAGLPAARSEVVSFGDETAIQIERYDRLRAGRALVRIHQEDACQALGVPPTSKYQSDGGPGPADIAGLFRRTMPARIADAAVRQFADALLWNWVIAGTDAHAKNYSVLLSGSQVRLAPLYDVASALPYGTHERKLRLAMKLGNDYRLYGQRPATWSALAGQLGLDRDLLVERATLLVAHAPDAFSQAANEVGPLASNLPARLVDAVAVRVKRCETSLRGGAPGGARPTE
jgi:serine/threonine-protein kinase HipA